MFIFLSLALLHSTVTSCSIHFPANDMTLLSLGINSHCVHGPHSLHPSTDGSLAGSTLPVADKDAVLESLISFTLVSVTSIQISFLVQCIFHFSTLHWIMESSGNHSRKAWSIQGQRVLLNLNGHRDTEDPLLFLISIFHTLQGTPISQQHRTETYSQISSTEARS